MRDKVIGFNVLDSLGLMATPFTFVAQRFQTTQTKLFLTHIMKKSRQFVKRFLLPRQYPLSILKNQTFQFSLIYQREKEIVAGNAFFRKIIPDSAQECCTFLLNSPTRVLVHHMPLKYLPKTEERDI